MPQAVESIDSRYDALMFAKTPETARQAAEELVKAVLGAEALARPLSDSLREVCRRLRPARDPNDEQRFEDEFVELAIWPGKQNRIAA
jgi:HEPN domain-containing protein